MSDLGLLSQQYQALSALVRTLRQHAVQVKRSYYQIPDPDKEDATTTSELNTACAELARVVLFLHDVVDVENEGEWPEQWVAEPLLPSAMVKRLRDAHVYDRPLYVSRLRRLAEHLQQGVGALTDRDIDLLDTIVLAANADINAVFRRLMRWA